MYDCDTKHIVNSNQLVSKSKHPRTISQIQSESIYGRNNLTFAKWD
jgi:hypothetical protein